ncbi:MAG: FecR domain-containing protein [Prolixibacteraceae bacterium]|nr:FecR domain-containing protein [Prolixibacteraceae bacterium]
MSEIWKHIARTYDRDNAPDEIHQLPAEVKNDPHFREALEDSKQNLQNIDLFFQLKSVNTEAAWEKVNQQTSRKAPQRMVRIGKLLRVAAAVLLLLATGFLVRQVLENSPVKYVTADNDYSHPRITLPDGSTVTLNHGSTIRYPKHFKGSTREVVLKGEAFFEVVTKPDMSFIVKTKKTAIRVLGTSFNVMAYDSTETVQVYVKTGRVEVSDEHLADHHKLTLLPGELGTFHSKTLQVNKISLEHQNPLAWYSNELTFEFTTLGEVIATLEHVYHVYIETAPDIDLRQQITATFKRQNPDYIVEVVTLALDLRFTKTSANTYFIQPVTE